LAESAIEPSEVKNAILPGAAIGFPVAGPSLTTLTIGGTIAALLLFASKHICRQIFTVFPMASCQPSCGPGNKQLRS
jgi:hypothetical protein